MDCELIVLSDHEPRPLRYEFEHERSDLFVWDQRKLDEDVWQVAVRRISIGPTRRNLESFLQHCSTFVDLDHATLGLMISEAEERLLVSGAVLAEQGAWLGACAVMHTGVIAAIASSSDGREQLLYEAFPFETFAEMELLDGGACSGRLVAAYGEAHIVLIPRPLVIETAQKVPMFALRLGVRAASRARSMAERVTQLAFSSTTSRIAMALLPYACPAAGMVPTLPPLSHMSQEQIATIAGTVRIVAARALSKLARENAIELCKGKVVRIDRERLRMSCRAD